ncbi:MAG: SIS domain-containing protein [Spirochaetaceae bacterium]|jgi:arabinose-5-phosphate isomerase|nr:SIS domain-containing protein [Spirochaetaceae bacterium]
MISKEIIRKSMLDTITNEAHAVAELANTVDFFKLEAVVVMLAECREHIITTGCGTSGAAAKKIAQVFNCIDRAAQFLNPADAPHGDYGMIRPGDIVIIFSKSGKTTEMNSLIPIARTRGARIIGVTEGPDSPVAKASDISLVLNTGPEACPYQCLASTSATAVFVLFDAISIAVMLYNGVDTGYFKQFHPAGGVGAMLLGNQIPGKKI